MSNPPPRTSISDRPIRGARSSRGRSGRGGSGSGKDAIKPDGKTEKGDSKQEVKSEVPKLETQGKKEDK